MSYVYNCKDDIIHHTNSDCPYCKIDELTEQVKNEREECIHIVRMQIARMRASYMGIAASCLETCLKEMEARK